MPPHPLRMMIRSIMQATLAYLSQHRKWLIQTVVLALVYYLGARLGLLLAFENSNSSPIWPPAGIALAGVLLCGWRVWPGVWLGAFFANVVVFTHNHAASPFTVIFVSALIAGGNTLEALFGRTLCERWLARSSGDDVVSGMEDRLLSGKTGAFQFAAMALITATVSAWIGPVTVAVAGICTWSDFPLVWISWWFGDASAIFLFTPFFLILRDLPRLKETLSPLWEIVAAFGFLVLVVGTIFGEWFGLNEGKLPLTFVTLIPPIWIALRVGLRGTIAAIFVLSVMTIWHTKKGLGPFAQPSETESLLLLLSYLWTLSCTSLVLAGTVAVRQRSETLLRSITDHSADMIFAKDEKSRVVFMNNAGLRILGQPLEQVVGHSDNEFHMNATESDTFLMNDRRVMNLKMTETVEETLTNSSGRKLILMTTKTPRLDAKGKVIGLVGVARDITELKRHQDELCRLNEELENRVLQRTSALQCVNAELRREIHERHRLENEMLHVAEQEQRRLGQYLHEELSQHLVGIGFLCRVLTDKLNAEQHPKANRANELSDMLQEALDSTRDLAKRYYPVELETGGLITALRSLAERTTRLFGVNCYFKSDENLTFFSDAQSSIHFYRIAQEAVTNALKHGKASHIVIECKTTDDLGSITITDDGRGFDPKNDSDGLGLHFMRYRARLVGAEMEVRKPGPNGCSVTCTAKVQR